MLRVLCLVVLALALAQVISAFGKHPFPTPLPRHASMAKIVTWPTEGVSDRDCYNAPTLAAKYLEEGMPYPDKWVIHLVCDESAWEKLLIQEHLDCATHPEHCTVSAFTIISLPAGEAPVPGFVSSIPAGNTFLRAHNFIWNDHPMGARHTMLHELGHIMVGTKEEVAEAWALEWEHEYPEKRHKGADAPQFVGPREVLRARLETAGK